MSYSIRRPAAHHAQPSSFHAGTSDTPANAARAWAVEGFNVGIWELNPVTNELYWSKRARELLGVAPDVPEDWDLGWSAIHPDDRGWIPAALDRAMDPLGDGHYHVDFRIVHPDGRIVWVDSRARAVFKETPEGRRAVGLFGAMLDITERKQAEADVRQSEAHFHALADLVPDLLWSNNVRAKSEWYNQRWFEYTAQTSEEARGDGWLEVIHPDDRETVLRNLHIAVERGAPLRHEHRIRRSDGVYRWFLVQVRPVRDEQGQISSWYGAATDIHEERMARIAAEQARAEAEAAVHVRDQFLSMASHELRTPLTALSGYAYVLGTVAQSSAGEIPKLTDTITRQVERLTRLIDRLLDISRLQQGQLVIERHPVDIVALAATTVADFRATLPATSSHTVELRCPAGHVLIEGDADRLEEVLFNLLSNAVKYSPEGGPVHVVIGRSAAEAIVEVQDQGIGIPVDAQPHVFAAFYRARNGRAQAPGFGLGLHIVGEIVQRHNGRIEVDSAEGVGSTFRVLLPLLDTAR